MRRFLLRNRFVAAAAAVLIGGVAAAAFSGGPPVVHAAPPLPSDSVAVTFSPSSPTPGQTTTVTATVIGVHGCDPTAGGTVTFQVVDPTNNTVLSSQPVPINTFAQAQITFTPATTGSYTANARFNGVFLCPANEGTATVGVVNPPANGPGYVVLGVTDLLNHPLPATIAPGTTIEFTGIVGHNAPGCTFTPADLPTDGAQMSLVTPPGQPVAGLTVVQAPEVNGSGDLERSWSYTVGAPGTYNFRFDWQGTQTCTFQSSNTVAVNVAKGTTTLDLQVLAGSPPNQTTNPSSVTVGTPLTLHATVTPTGCTLDPNNDVVIFLDHGTILTTAPVNANHLDQNGDLIVEGSYTPQSSGTLQLTAKYEGSMQCASNISGAQTINVGVIGTQTTVSPIPANKTSATPGDTLSFGATVTGGNGCTLSSSDTVTFTVSGPVATPPVIVALTPNGNGSLGNATFQWPSPATPGAYQVNAAYTPHNGSNCGSSTSATPATVTLAYTTGKTTLTVSGSPNPSQVNSPVAFTITIDANYPSCVFTQNDGAPTLTFGTTPVSGLQLVTFNTTGGAFGHGTEIWSGSYTPTTAVGSPFTVQASWAGNNTCQPSSGSYKQTVNRGSATVSVTSSDNPSTVNHQVKFTATLTAANGCVFVPGDKVKFEYGSGGPHTTKTLTAGDISNNGQSATVSWNQTPSAATPGTVVTASFAQNDTCTAASGSVTQVVLAASAGGISLNPNPEHITLGQTATFTATITTAGGCLLTNTDTVTFTGIPAGVTPTYQLSGDKHTLVATVTFTPTAATTGTAVTAQYSGNQACVGQTSANATLIVDKVAPTLTVVSSANPSNGGQPLTFTAVFGGACVPQTSDTVSFTYNGQPFGGPVNPFFDNTGDAYNGKWIAVSSSNVPPGTTSAAGVPVVATYTPNNNPNCLGATGTINQVVNGGGSTTVLTSNQDHKTVSPTTQVTYTATVTGGPGCTPQAGDTVNFSVNGGPSVPETLANVGGSLQATFTTTLPPNSTPTVTATYPATTFCLSPSSGSDATVTVSAPPPGQPQVTVTTNPLGPVNNGAGVILTATVTAANGCTPSNADTIQFSYGSFTSGQIALSGGSASLTTPQANPLPNGADTITATYTANTAGCANSSGTTTIQVNAVGGNAVTGNNFNYTVNTPVTNQKVATIADPSCTAGTTYSISIDWGDGSTPTTASNVTAASLGGCNNLAVTGTHTYTAGGSHNVKVTVTGSDLFNGSATATATPVNNNSGGGSGIPPTYTPPLPYNGQGYQPNPMPHGPV